MIVIRTLVIQTLFVFFKLTFKRLKQDDCMLSLFGLALKQSQSMKYQKDAQKIPAYGPICNLNRYLYGSAVIICLV